mmetsp:Transcript_25894/g.62382  ORF Transcript_25894/g.62382 Transcript_25894/m.62382 type:complete len:552 (+) Transcript_25894:149-1804(+)|eukprot:CAMPEP_0114495298 /NCGR_PEP_ID=MMETSP0109-20121206/5133_1 /TAXON_ID=29199 /ORGANISM="Chlorarachnion reptans, Strain CCCM449" /LENGTH=551 /DNA_ID=CAMNT_0001672437 /DNA_START=261 /DNA_END=1916 /DNA_ORIENTATION=+
MVRRREGRNEDLPEGRNVEDGPDVSHLNESDRKKFHNRQKSLQDNAWFMLGLWQGPRLRKDWEDDDKEEDRHILSLNLFFDAMFSFTISHLGFEVRNTNDQDVAAVINWWKRFGIIMSLWLTTAEFSARFDNDDIPHKFFWSLYGLSSILMMVHSTGGPNSRNAIFFAGSVAVLYLLLALHYYRNARSLPRCRFFCLIRAALCLVFSLAAGLACGLFMEAREGILFFLALEYPISIAVLSVGKLFGYYFWFRHMPAGEAMRRLDLPLHNEFLINRCLSFTLMVLGQIILSIAVNPDVGFRDLPGLYIALALGFIILVSMKLFLFDVNYSDIHDHALNGPRAVRLLWRLLFPFGVGSLALFGTGIALLVNISGDFESQPKRSFSYWIACGTLTMFLLINVIERQLHLVPYTKLLEESRLNMQAKTMYGIHYFQCLMQVVVALIIVTLPVMVSTEDGGAKSMLAIIASFLVMLVIINIMDEVALIKGHFMRPARRAIMREKQSRYNLRIPLDTRGSKSGMMFQPNSRGYGSVDNGVDEEFPVADATEDGSPIF